MKREPKIDPGDNYWQMGPGPKGMPRREKTHEYAVREKWENGGLKEVVIQKLGYGTFTFSRDNKGKAILTLEEAPEGAPKLNQYRRVAEWIANKRFKNAESRSNPDQQ